MKDFNTKYNQSLAPTASQHPPRKHSAIPSSNPPSSSVHSPHSLSTLLPLLSLSHRLSSFITLSTPFVANPSRKHEESNNCQWVRNL
jgi:hypothetical protein